MPAPGSTTVCRHPVAVPARAVVARTHRWTEEAEGNPHRGEGAEVDGSCSSFHSELAELGGFKVPDGWRRGESYATFRSATPATVAARLPIGSPTSRTG